MQEDLHLFEHVLAHVGAVVDRDVRIPRLQGSGVPLMVPASGKRQGVTSEQ